MAKALLVINDPVTGRPVIALGPDGQPLVGDPATGEGWDCCCGQNDPSCCFSSDLEFGCGVNQGPWCCNWGADFTFETQGEYHDIGNVSGSITKNDWFERRKDRYFADIGPNGECRGYYVQCLEYVDRQIFTDSSGVTHTQVDQRDCFNSAPQPADTRGPFDSTPILLENATGYTGVEECIGSYNSTDGAEHYDWHYVFQPCQGWDIAFNRTRSDFGGARTIEQHVTSYSRIVIERGCTGDPCGPGGIRQGAARSASGCSTCGNEQLATATPDQLRRIIESRQ